jgi:hypothetical protein
MKAYNCTPYLSACALRRLLTVLFLAVCVCDQSQSQVYVMGQAAGINGSTVAALNGTTITTCGGTFTDPGGAGSNYGNSQDFTLTFTSGTTAPITFDFGTTFNTQATNDILRIYDGPNTSARLLYTVSGVHNGASNKVGQLSSTGNSLTFRFTSNGSTNNAGWTASIQCSPAETYGDACVGGLAGMFLFKEDFEPVSPPVNYNIGPPLAASLTGYTYKNIPDTTVGYMINDSEYGIVKNAIYGGGNMPRAWANFKDHTSGNGYMMLINANYDPDTVYNKTVAGLTGNTTYFVSAYIHTASASISITNCTGSNPSFGNIKNANIDFKILNMSDVLVAINSTGNIQPVDPDPANWRLYNTFYTTGPGETSFKFQITNRASGGCGNDFAIDDIEVRACPSGAAHVLPSKLGNFTVAPVEDRYVFLEWITIEEKDSHSFIIERSRDGVKWETLRVISAGGNSAVMRSYNEHDFNPYEGISYYRLKQTDKDGKSSYSDVKKVNFNGIRNNTALISAGPNPFINNMKVTVKLANSEQVSIELCDLMGKTIYTRTYSGVAGTNNFSIDNIPSVASGVYTMVVKHSGVTDRIKVMKQ